jgi:2-polyprenyl-3-methyl-5-hydroxy-6-metoxy-1,4-benzoquinol methylase
VAPACRLCSGTNLKRLYVFDPGCTVLACRQCGLVQVAEVPTRVQLQAIYSRDYFSHAKYTHDRAVRREQARRLALIRRHLPRRARLLEVGCGSGEFMTAAKGEYQVWGLDLSPFAIDKARAANPDCAANLHCGTLEDQAHDAGGFDAVAAWDVIEHVWEPRVFLAQMKRLLKPGGMIFLSTPNAGSPVARAMGRRWAFMTPPEHLCLFRRDSLARLLSQFGFRIDAWTSRGKWVNVGFLFYKLNRVFPGLIPGRVLEGIQQGVLGSLTLYIPTGDVQYVVIKPE